MRMKIAVLGLAALLVPAAAGAAEPAQNDPRLGAQVDRICTGRSINRFGDATESSVVVSTPGDRHYLIETVGQCYALEHALRLGLNQDSVCLSAGDALMPSTGAAMPGAQMTGRNATDPRARRRPPTIGSCQIDTIHEWMPAAVSAPEHAPAER